MGNEVAGQSRADEPGPPRDKDARLENSGLGDSFTRHGAPEDVGNNRWKVEVFTRLGLRQSIM